MSNRRRLYTPRSTMIVHDGGKRVVLTAGKTLVREGHELLKANPDKFREVTVDFETTAARKTGKRIEDITDTVDVEE